MNETWQKGNTIIVIPLRNLRISIFERLKMSNAKRDFAKQLEECGHGSPESIIQVGVTELTDSKLLAEVTGAGSFWLKNADGSGTFVQSVPTPPPQPK